MPDTIYDLIDNYWGRDPLSKILRADKIALTRFGKSVNSFYEIYQPPVNPQAALRTYYGGFVAVNFSLSGKQTTLFNNLLYAHSTIIPDPIARWYFDRYEELAKTPAAVYAGGEVDQSEWMSWLLTSNRAFRWSLEASRDVLHYFVSGLLQLRPLVESGIIVLVSQPQILLDKAETIVREALQDASSRDFFSALRGLDEHLPVWDNLRGGVMTPRMLGSAVDPSVVSWAQAKEASYHIRKNLAIAEWANGHYMPENATDFKILESILRSSGARAGYSNWQVQVAQRVGRMTLPSLEGAPIAELIAIRKSATAFDDFRIWLARRLASDAQIELTSAELETEISKLRERLSTCGVIKEYLRSDGIKTVVTVLLGVATGARVGQTVAGGVVGALAGVLAGLGQRDRVRDSVIARLASMNRVAPDATLGVEGKVGGNGIPRPLAAVLLGEVRTGPNPPAPGPYTTAKLRDIVGQAMQPNPSSTNPFRAIPAK